MGLGRFRRGLKRDPLKGAAAQAILRADMNRVGRDLKGHRAQPRRPSRRTLHHWSAIPFYPRRGPPSTPRKSPSNTPRWSAARALTLKRARSHVRPIADTSLACRLWPPPPPPPTSGEERRGGKGGPAGVLLPPTTSAILPGERLHTELERNRIIKLQVNSRHACPRWNPGRARSPAEERGRSGRFWGPQF